MDIESLPSLPRNHYGYTLSKSDDLPIEVISAVSIEPETPDEPLIPETPDNTVPESPDESEVPENNAPVFSDGAITVRTVTENTIANTNIGIPVTATDADEDTLTYSLSGTLAASFDIVSATGQLLTKAALDYEVMSVYPLTVTVSDGMLTDTITVVISIIDELETAIVSMSVPVSERTAQVRDAIVNAVPNISNAEDVTTEHLAAITALDLRNKGITELKSGDFFGLSGLTNLNLFNNMLTRLPVGTFSGLTSLTTLRLGGNLIDPLPLIISLQQVAVNQYQAVISTASPFKIELPINVTNGSISGNTANVVIEKGNIYSDTFTVIPTSTMSLPLVDIGTLPSIPVNHYGYILTKSVVCNRTSQVAEGIAAAVPNVEDCNNVTEVDIALITSLNLSDKSIMSLHSDDFAGLYSLAILNLSKNNLTELPNGIFSGLGSLNSIDLSENSVDPLPVNISLLKIGENGIKVVIPTGAPFDIVLPLMIENGNIEDGSTTITIPKTKTESNNFTVTRTPETIGAVTVDIGSLPDLPMGHVGYALAKTNESPLGIYDSIKVAPVFSEGDSTSRSIAENTAAGVNIGDVVSATDANNDTLMYSLGGTDAAVFDIDSITGQLKTKAALDFETKSTYAVTITVSDGELTDSIEVTINVTDLEEVVITPNTDPVFTDGESTTRAIAENATIGSNIGTPVSATDSDDDELTYSLSGTDASSFSIDSSTGQLKTNTLLDYETKSSYSVTVSVSDDEDGSDSITVTINVTDVDERSANNAPEFTDGDEATRTVAENTALGENLGDPFSATDEDEDTLTYSLSGTDAASFSIDSTTGQLKTNEPLDFERKTSYSVVISVSDGEGGSDSITVTINVTDVEELPANNDPVFTDGNEATRSVEENTSSGVNIGDPVSATDADGDNLIYSLSGPDASLFSIDTGTAQLQTSSDLDFEIQSEYSVVVNVSDGNGGIESIVVTIAVTNVNEAPDFDDGDSTSRTIAENTDAGVNIGAPISATDVDGDNLNYSLGGTDDASFDIDSSSGQLKTNADLNFETKNAYEVTITVSDNQSPALTDTITVNITINDVNDAPEFPSTETGARNIDENTAADTAIGAAVAATDEDTLPSADTLTYTLGGTDMSSFDIVSTSGQIRTKTALNFETKSSYSVDVTVTDDGSDPGLTDTITVTISVNDVNDAPVFSGSKPTTRSIDENTAANMNIGAAVAATDEDTLPSADTLTYELSGTDAASFDIDSSSGQIKTKEPLDHETDASLSVTVTVTDNGSDPGLTDTIDVTININDVNEAPEFTATTATRSVNENVTAGTNIGAVVSAMDVDDGDSLTYTHSDTTNFDIDSTSGQLKTKSDLDHETTDSYTVIVTATDTGTSGVTDSELSDSITVTINVNDVNDRPKFAGTSATRSIAENTAANMNIGDAVGATDEDKNTDNTQKDTLTYTLEGTDASSFNIVSTSGQLQTKAALDKETKDSYSVTVKVTDDSGDTNTNSASIPVTITVTNVNEAPTFATGTLTFSIGENTATNQNIGTAVTATDPDSGDSPSYSLDTTGDATFNIDSTTGQIKTEVALDHETTSSYSVTVTATDGSSLTATKSVTINVTDENDAPIFPTGSDMRSVPENSAAITNVGEPVAATDQDDNMITYMLSGTDSSSFTIDSSGQIKTTAAHDFETKNSYTVMVDATEDSGESNNKASVTVTISITDVNDAPEFTDGETTTRSVAENMSNGSSVGTPVAASDEDEDSEGNQKDTLIYSLSGTDVDKFTIESSTGQIRTAMIFTVDMDTEYTVVVTAADRPADDPTTTEVNENEGVLTDTITVTITVTNVGGAPALSAVPTQTALLSNYPNPFNPETWIPYQLSKPSDVTLTIYNLRGVVVREIAISQKPAGNYISRSRAMYWDGRNSLGEKVAAGVYFYTFKTGDYSATRKMLIRK